LRGEPGKFAECREQLDRQQAGEPFTPREQAALHYVDRLTQTPGGVGPADTERLRAAGFDDGHILEINQVTAYFAYANRTVTGLGVDTSGETLGFAPDDTTEDWHHHL